MIHEPTIHAIYERLAQVPGLVHAIGLYKATHFIRLAAYLKRELLHNQQATLSDSDIPETLPGAIRTFLSAAMGLSSEMIDGCWGALKRNVWLYDPHEHSTASDATVFDEHAPAHARIGTSHFYSSRTSLIHDL
jgi:hypothetical protein